MARSASMTGSGRGLRTTSRHRASEPFGIAFNPVDGRSRSGSMMRHPSRCSMGPRSLRGPHPMSAGSTTGTCPKSPGRAMARPCMPAAIRRSDRRAPVVAWADRGRGARRLLTSGATNTIMSLMPLPGGALLVAAQDPHVALLQVEGTVGWAVPSPLFDARGQKRTLAVSADGMLVDFGYESGGKAPARFDLRQRQLLPARPADGLTAPPRQAGLALDGGITPTSRRSTAPRCTSRYERSRSLAMHPDTQPLCAGHRLVAAGL